MINASFLQDARRTLLLSFTLALISILPANAFFTVDETTSGNWTSRYGAAGFLIADGPAKWVYPRSEFINANQWVWTRGTGFPQALEYPGNSRGGLATCWYSPTTFTVWVGFPDREEHAISFYFLDWDNAGRVQKIEQLDGAGRLVAELELRNFQNGKYVTFSPYNVVGLRITRLAGPNAVLSGIFVGGAYAGSVLDTPPTIEPAGGDFEGSVDVTMSASSEIPTAIYFTTDGNDPAVNGMAYMGPVNLTQDAVIRAITRSKYGPSPEAMAPFKIAPATSEFLGLDRTTLGNWMGNYGHDGYFITMFPPTIGAVTHDASQWVWNWSTTDPSALQKPTAPRERIAACWYAPHSFDISVPISDDAPQTISVYALDWDNAGRVQQIDLIDTAAQIVIDSHQLSDFADGAYLRWRVSRDVTIRVVNRGGPNVVLSGVFLDPASMERVPAPTIVHGGPPGQPTQVEIGTGTPGATIHYTLDGTTPTRNSTLYTGSFYLTSDAVVSAIAFKDGMLPSTVTSVFVDANPPGSGSAQVQFLREDSVTQGSWKGTYGSLAFWLAGDSGSMPPPYNAPIFNTAQHVWAFNVTDPAAVQKNSSPERIAACRFAPETFTVIAEQPDAEPREFSLYFLDWDVAGRVQKIEALDSAGTVLDTRTLSAFEDGKYLIWSIRGQVTFRITRLQGPNAVLSALFFEE